MQHDRTNRIPEPPPPPPPPDEPALVRHRLSGRQLIALMGVACFAAVTGHLLDVAVRTAAGQRLGCDLPQSINR